MKVLMINTVPIVWDGITTVMLNYAANMDRSDVEIDFLSGNEVAPDLRKVIEETGVGLYRIPGRNRHPLRYFFQLSRLIRENGYQVVHAHGNSCTLAVELLAAKRGGARVRCPHSHNTSTNQPLLHRLLRPLFDGATTHGFACGEAAGRWLYGNRPFTVLNNGICAERYAFNPADRAEYRKRLGLDGRIAVGHVANFVPYKNHAFLIDAFAALHARDARYALVLVGGGALMEDVRARVRAAGLEDAVTFTGTTREVPRLLSAMDVMALPSLHEGLPNVLIEWQAAGLPALVADTVTPEARLTALVRFLPLERDAWVEALLAAPVDADRADASAKAVRAIAEAGYDIRQNAARLKALYRQYVNEAYSQAE